MFHAQTAILLAILASGCVATLTPPAKKAHGVPSAAVLMRPTAATNSVEGNPASSLVANSPMASSFLYQLNSELVGRLGAFVTPDNSDPPQPVAFTHIASISPAENLRGPGFQSVDALLFMLDGMGGNLYFSVGAANLYYMAHPDFAGAKRVAIASEGQIALIQNDSAINLCWIFDGDRISRGNNCIPPVAIGNAQEIVAFGSGDFLVYSPDSGFTRIKPNGDLQSIQPPLPVTNLMSVFADQSIILITDQGGGRVLGWDPRSQAILFNQTQNKFVIPGQTVNELRYIAAVPMPNGTGLAVVPANSDTVFFLDKTFKMIGAHISVSGAYPIRRINPIQGLSINLSGGTLAYWSPRGVNVAVIGANVDYDFTYLVPPSLSSVSSSLTDPAVGDALTQNPRANLLDLPGVQSALATARSQL